MDVDKNINYTQQILRGLAQKKYKRFFVGCKDSEKVLAGYQWSLGATNYVTMEQFWTWVKSDSIYVLVYLYLVLDRCRDSEKYIWLELVNSIRTKHRSTFGTI